MIASWIKVALQIFGSLLFEEKRLPDEMIAEVTPSTTASLTLCFPSLQNGIQRRQAAEVEMKSNDR